MQTNVKKALRKQQNIQTPIILHLIVVLYFIAQTLWSSWEHSDDD